MNGHLTQVTRLQQIEFSLQVSSAYEGNTQSLLDEMDKKIEAEESRLERCQDDGQSRALDEFWNDQTAMSVDRQLQHLADEAVRSRRLGASGSPAAKMMAQHVTAAERLQSAMRGCQVRRECFRCLQILPGARGVMVGKFAS